MYTQFQSENQEGRDSFKELDVLRERILLKLMVNVCGEELWAGFIWLRIKFSNRFLWAR
jgi:hypothetical protein